LMGKRGPQPNGAIKRKVVAQLDGRQELKRGEAAEIARRAGCSREWVRQVMLRLHVTVEQAPVKQCESCGRRIYKGSTRDKCVECWRQSLRITLTCSACGKEFQRLRHDYFAYHARFHTEDRYSPRCSRSCVVAKPQVCSWCGQLTKPKFPSNVSVHTFCTAPALCYIEAMKLLQPVHWRFIPSPLFPMKDHIAEIRELRASLKSLPGTRFRAERSQIANA